MLMRLGHAPWMQPHNRFVHRSLSMKGEHPWQVSIQSCRFKDCPGDTVGKHFCGGTLIGPRWVLTAAHCALAVLNLSSDRVQIVFGTSHIDKLAHPAARTKENDIALLKLKGRVQFSKNGPPSGLYPGIPGPELCDIQGDHVDQCVVTGYGRISEGGRSSPKLKAATILFVPTEKCQKQIPQKVIQKTMMCAGAEGRDACQGDSGGPLVCKLKGTPDNKFYLMGVTSWGIGCATPHTPGVYSEVACYMDWIKNVTKHV
ncbi:unnamed protein product [Notodromas monacha]|uniref:Peptidase S1 domain-containing protein n=1 Tax=Notodromas monacha TaxID=399045 RepID=A0A7R9GJ93_9CRUS|nr:unnamed protein product [Notodromas monacha]CAG0924748.1 unnamed protein product [Notodromas monacha]